MLRRIEAAPPLGGNERSLKGPIFCYCQHGSDGATGVRQLDWRVGGLANLGFGPESGERKYQRVCT